MIFTKAAVLCFYYNLSKFVWFRRSVIVVWIISFMLFTALALVAAFQCHPIRFGHGFLHAKCINIVAYFEAGQALNIALDILIVLMPSALLWNLQLRPREKILVMAMFGVGGL